MSITSDQIKSDWELGDPIIITMDADGEGGTDGDGGADGGDADGGDA
jgi:hypothetical protein